MVVQKSVEQITLNDSIFNPKEALENLAGPRIDNHLDYQEANVDNIIALHQEKHDLRTQSNEQLYSMVA